MYISRVEIDFQNRKKTKELNHLGAYHNWVEKSFFFEQDVPRKRHLWRIDSIGKKFYLIVVSEEKPDLEKLEAYGVPKTAQTKSYSPYLNSLEEGKRMRFRVTLNPTISKVVKGHKRGKVYPCISIDHQMYYLFKRCKQLGFSLLESEVYIVERGFKRLYKNGKSIKLVKVSYEGILTIQDKGKFIHTLTKGIGKEKAYGCGLLTVIPVKE